MGDFIIRDGSIEIPGSGGKRAIRFREGTGTTFDVVAVKTEVIDEAQVTINAGGGGGSGNISGTLTSGKIPVASGAHTLVDSNESDDGTTFAVGKRIKFPAGSDVVLAAGANDNLDIGDRTYVRLDSSAGDAYITGMIGVADGRVVWLINNGVNNVYVSGSSPGSTGLNRFFVLGAHTVPVVDDGNLPGIRLRTAIAVPFVYDSTHPVSGKWKLLSEPPNMGGSPGSNNEIAAWDSGDSVHGTGVFATGGKITDYGGEATRGLGVPPIRAFIEQQYDSGSAIIGPQAFEGSTGPGIYRISFTLLNTQRDTGTVQIQFSWTDSSGANRTSTATLDVSGSNVVSAPDSGEIPVNCLMYNGSSGGVSYQLLNSPPGSAVVNFYATLEKLAATTLNN